MARRKKPPEHVNHERWLVSYADFITLLFAFFTAMYAISNADTAKLQKLMQSMASAFGGPEAGKAKPVMGASASQPFSPQFQAAPGSPVSLNIGRVTEEQVLKVIQDRVEKYLVRGIDEGKVKVVISDRGLIISIADEDLFRSGSAEINPAAYPMLSDIGLSLVDLPNYVRVEGHTDNTPVGGGPYPTNWELSSARASRIVRFLADRVRFPPERLCATGYGEYRPASTNGTPQGRAANRKVEIIVLKNRLSLTEP
jgi:chemotaxis protein MotB